ncbi:AraC family transcriptional regulator [Thalassotalea sp. Y01]|uniref:helix-turn-helix domain-containing protein n=1 Tax=Thalassotalea sp. Y01 TaxID=2729613 RepID=UPI00145FA9CF|nr:AraC family transcriptional regulator [Thalassotalea sp. Y01]NMP17306.1 AraC family transcriptional regulator [Thalassotalea sp. Y01]
MKSTADTTQLLVSATINIAPFIDYCENHRLDWRTAANECDLPTDIMTSEGWLPSQDLLKFLAAINKHFGYDVAIQVGRLVTVRQLSVALDDALKHCDNLAEGIAVLIDEMPTLNNHVTFWVEKDEQHWWLCHRGSARPHLPGFEESEWFRTLALINFCRLFLGQSWRPSKAKLVSSNKNEDKLPPHFKLSNIEFSQVFGAINVPLADDYQLLNYAKNTPQWHQSIVKLINTYAILPWFNIEWFAALLGMTSRTLQRNLKQKQIIFSEVRDSARKKMAVELLKDKRVSIEDVAWQLGYNDLSNFNRAFKKWYRMTAPTYRRNITTQ